VARSRKRQRQIRRRRTVAVLAVLGILAAIVGAVLSAAYVAVTGGTDLVRPTGTRSTGGSRRRSSAGAHVGTTYDRATHRVWAACYTGSIRVYDDNR
jgi:hypothetical protein